MHQGRIWHLNVKEKPTGKEQTKGIGTVKMPGPRGIRKMWACFLCVSRLDEQEKVTVKGKKNIQKCKARSCLGTNQ